MPRRRVLTDAQLDNLLALPTTEPDLIGHWTLDAADGVAIVRRRGGPNRLGYALQLCAFRYPGRLLRPGEALLQSALRFVADQINVTADELATYAARRRRPRDPEPGDGPPLDGGSRSGETMTGTNSDRSAERDGWRRASRRQPNSCWGVRPWRRATPQTVSPPA